MDTTIKNATPLPAAKCAPAKVPPVDSKTAAPEKVETAQAVTASDRTAKSGLQQSAPSTPMTTYRDQDSGRLIVRVYDRKHGDILVEFPPERAFRSVEEVLKGVGKTPNPAHGKSV